MFFVQQPSIVCLKQITAEIKNKHRHT